MAIARFAGRMGVTGDFAQAYVLAREVGHHVQNLLGTSEQVQQMRGRVGDLDGAPGAASAVGDDRLKRQARGCKLPG